MANQSGTYKINFKCSNCMTIFEKTLMLGTTAFGHAGVCPYCGCTEDTVVASGQKLGRFEVIPTMGAMEKNKKVELLLEKKIEGR